tara:strand:- start:38588 stop:40168 length:1581 start_codon:yes stop_codon:yes gene_type:complete
MPLLVKNKSLPLLIAAILYSTHSFSQWTSSNGFAELANPTLNVSSESIKSIQIWNDSLVGCFGQSYLNLSGAYSSVGYYSTMKKSNGELNSSLLAPRVLPITNPYNMADIQNIYPELGLGLSEERKLSFFGSTPSYHFGCFKLGSSQYLWQSPDTIQIASKPIIENGDTLIWLLTIKNKFPQKFIKVNLITGDTVIVHNYSQIVPKSQNPNNVFSPQFVGQSNDSIFIEYISIKPNSFDSIGKILGIKKIRVYKFSNFTLLDSFDTGLIDILKEMIPVNTNDAKPFYRDEENTLFPGSPNTALRSIRLTSWKRDSIKKLSFYSEYYINSTTGSVFLPHVRIFKQFDYTLIWTDTYYPNQFDPAFDNIASRLLMFDQNYNLKYQIASTDFDIDRIIYDLVVDSDGAVFFKGQQRSTNEFFDVGKIDPNGNHPWFKNFVGQDELSLRPLLNLYPNPSRGQLTLSNYPYDFNKVQLALFDVQGRIMDASLQADLNGLINLPSHLSNGFYYLKIKDSLNTDETFKVLLSH